MKINQLWSHAYLNWAHFIIDELYSVIQVFLSQTEWWWFEMEMTFMSVLWVVGRNKLVWVWKDLNFRLSAPVQTPQIFSLYLCRLVPASGSCFHPVNAHPWPVVLSPVGFGSAPDQTQGWIRSDRRCRPTNQTHYCPKDKTVKSKKCCTHGSRQIKR